MKNIITVILVTSGIFGSVYGQEFIFGPKGGLAIGLQNWNGVERDPLFRYHGDIYMESADNPNNALFTQIGYHIRGSAEQVLFFSGPGNFFQRQGFEFRNVVLIMGAKKRFNQEKKNKAYYAFGARIEYTIGTNLDQYAAYGGYFPVDAFVNKFNYGGSLMLGQEFSFSDALGAFIEINVSPDISKQYDQPQIPNVISPFTGNRVTLSQQTIRNISFELTLGLRILRKVIYQ